MSAKPNFFPKSFTRYFTPQIILLILFSDFFVPIPVQWHYQILIPPPLIPVPYQLLPQKLRRPLSNPTSSNSEPSDSPDSSITTSSVTFFPLTFPTRLPRPVRSTYPYTRGHLTSLEYLRGCLQIFQSPHRAIAQRLICIFSRSVATSRASARCITVPSIRVRKLGAYARRILPRWWRIVPLNYLLWNYDDRNGYP